MNQNSIDPVKQEKVIKKRTEMILEFVNTRPAALTDEEMMIKFSLSQNTLKKIFEQNNIVIENGHYTIKAPCVN